MFKRPRPSLKLRFHYAVAGPFHLNVVRCRRLLGSSASPQSSSRQRDAASNLRVRLVRPTTVYGGTKGSPWSDRPGTTTARSRNTARGSATARRHTRTRTEINGYGNVYSYSYS
eukprot:scaffold155322_cov35-Prasinocladus_malaysianus.AAC.1